MFAADGVAASAMDKTLGQEHGHMHKRITLPGMNKIRMHGNCPATVLAQQAMNEKDTVASLIPRIQLTSCIPPMPHKRMSHTAVDALRGLGALNLLALA
jgi:hypothetical protein